MNYTVDELDAIEDCPICSELVEPRDYIDESLKLREDMEDTLECIRRNERFIVTHSYGPIGSDVAEHINKLYDTLHGMQLVIEALTQETRSQADSVEDDNAQG